MSNITLSSLFVYPIKSARGIEVERARVTALGLENDRRFMVVDPDGNFLTQRQHPELALLETAIENDTLVIQAPGFEKTTLPLHPDGTADRNVQIWSREARAVSMGPEIASYIGEHLHAKVELVYMPSTDALDVDPTFAARGEKVSFADGFPFLLTTEGSLADLNARLVDGVPMNRFRPNIVVRGAPPWAEDAWTSLSICDVVFYLSKPCQRCMIITIDQATGVRGKDPMAALSTFRARANRTYFGWNLLASSEGELHVNERVFLRATPYGAEQSTPGQTLEAPHA